jgi:hypothetical protein
MLSKLASYSHPVDTIGIGWQVSLERPKIGGFQGVSPNRSQLAAFGGY